MLRTLTIAATAAIISAGPAMADGQDQGVGSTSANDPSSNGSSASDAVQHGAQVGAGAVGGLLGGSLCGGGCAVAGAAFAGGIAAHANFGGFFGDVDNVGEPGAGPGENPGVP